MQEELITKISNLRGGAFVDVVAALGLMSAIIILLMIGVSHFNPIQIKLFYFIFNGYRGIIINLVNLDMEKMLGQEV
jgi:hypothetical protein